MRAEASLARMYLAVADAEANQRRGPLRTATDLARKIHAEHGDAVGAFDVAQGLAHAVRETGWSGRSLGIMVGDQVAEHLRVGLWILNVYPLPKQKRLYLGVVLDHPIVHEGEFAVAADVRMRDWRRLLRRESPTAYGRFLLVPVKSMARSILHKIFHPARLLRDLDASVLQDGHTRRSHNADGIREALQALENDGSCLLFACVTDNAAHIFR